MSPHPLPTPPPPPTHTSTSLPYAGLQQVARFDFQRLKLFIIFLVNLLKVGQRVLVGTRRNQAVCTCMHVIENTLYRYTVKSINKLQKAHTVYIYSHFQSLWAWAPQHPLMRACLVLHCTDETQLGRNSCLQLLLLAPTF